MENKCIHRCPIDACCEQNGQHCSEDASQDSMPCGGVGYKEELEEE